MSDDLEAYVRSPGPLPDEDYTNLAHRALDEVLKLSPEVVQPLEARIESDYQVARTEAKERFEREKTKIEREFQAESEQIRTRYDAQTEDIRADHEDHLSTVKLEAQRKRNKVNQKAAELERQAEKEHQDQVMVADFVAEGAVTKAKQKRLEAQSTVETARRYLDDLGAQADELLGLYRHPLRAAETADHTTYENPTETCRTQQALAEKHLETLRNMQTAQLFVGVRPVLLTGGIVGVVVTVLACLHLFGVEGLPSASVTLPVAAGAVIVLAALGGRLLWHRAKRRVRHTSAAFHEALSAARVALDQHYQKTLNGIEQEFQNSQRAKEAELQKAHSTLKQTKDDVAKQRATSLQEIEQQRREMLDRLKRKKDEALERAEREYNERRSALESRREEDLGRVQQRYDRDIRACEDTYHTSRRQLEHRWDEAFACIQALLRKTADFDERIAKDLNRLLSDSWAPPGTLPNAVRFGTFELDWRRIAETVRARAESMLDLSEPACVPALLEFPERCAVLLQSEREGRQRAIETLRAVMVRLFTSLPPGEVRFTILDPVGLGESFAGFMHAGDYQEALIGGRIWTETTQIQQQLEDLTGHMENVIQKYLRNEFETLEEYNQQAGELAEPYRFLVVADFPTNFSEESARRLSSIVHSGSRCGVYTLIEYDTRREMPQGIDIKDITANSIHLTYENGRYVWQDRVFRQFPLALDEPPAETTLTRIMHVVGKAGAESARVEVPFHAVAPRDGQYWSLDSREELRIPLGRTGATRLQYLRLGRGVAQHMLIAGKTGSGKSTLLHVMVTNLALWYAPDQVQVYLIDFKQGVEFKTYVTHDLPHARAVAIESDREFGLSILRRLDAEMTQRGELFRQKGVQDIAAYRESTGKPMPRTVLIVDEFQIFFAEDDKLAQDASVLLEKLVRQGRAFGIHVVLGSQTLGGVFGLARSTIGQMAVRIALQCSEADSQLILDDDNVAARLLSRPGEAIYNDVGGSVAGNSPFQTAWLPESTRDSYLSRVGEMRRDRQVPREDLIVFEGSAPADITENRQLVASLERNGQSAPVATPKIWLGAPVTIKEPTSITLRRQSGANVLMVGQRDDVAMNLMTAAVVSLAAQLPPPSVRLVILDGSPPDSPQAGVLPRVTEAIPNACQLVAWRDVPDVLAELSHEVESRTEAGKHDNQTVVVFIYGLQRYRVLRRSEDAFGFSMDEEAKARPDAQFADLLREGPSVGIHVVAWADTLSTLERTLDRQTMREFDHRVLFQMSAADSSNLIDSPVANQLGLHRVLLYSEEQGGIEKFRPYAPLEKDWLSRVAQHLSTKKSVSET
jgi:hypothetical protein